MHYLLGLIHTSVTDLAMANLRTWQELEDAAKVKFFKNAPFTKKSAKWEQTEQYQVENSGIIRMPETARSLKWINHTRKCLYIRHEGTTWRTSFHRVTATSQSSYGWDCCMKTQILKYKQLLDKLSWLNMINQKQRYYFEMKTLKSRWYKTID